MNGATVGRSWPWFVTSAPLRSPPEEAAAGNLRRTPFLWIGIRGPAFAAM
jgi:hypothetical protein